MKSKKTQNSHYRKDFLMERYILMSPKRAKRPQSKDGAKTSSCPFCPQNIKKGRIIRSFGTPDNWTIASINNLFAALDKDNKEAYGFQEVIVEDPAHDFNLSKSSAAKILDLLLMFRDRTEALSKDPRIEYVLCFKNQGRRAGASLEHSHSQVFASSLLPPLISEELWRQAEFTEDHGICPYCALIKKEARGPRLIYQDRHTLVFCPDASEFQYEAWILAKRHFDNISGAKEEELVSFAMALSLILRGIAAKDLDYNLFLHQAIRNDEQHFYIKIQPRYSIWAGVELGSGIIINPVLPEIAAKHYKNCNKKNK